MERAIFSLILLPACLEQHPDKLLFQNDLDKTRIGRVLLLTLAAKGGKINKQRLDGTKEDVESTGTHDPRSGPSSTLPPSSRVRYVY